jgi:hypothetical protein
MWLGVSLASWTMRSPKSVSMTSTLCAARKPLRWHSSVSMDLLFTSRVSPRSCRMPSTTALCSAASAAQCTSAPSRVAFRSNSSRYSARCERVWAFSASACVRSASHSGTDAAALSLFARTCHRAVSCQCMRAVLAT